MCASAGAILTGACLLSLAAQPALQIETGISAAWSQSSLITTCLLCAVFFSIAGAAGAFLTPKNRHTALNSFAIILSTCSLLSQITLAFWA